MVGWVVKGSEQRRIVPATLSYWISQGYSPDDDRDGVADTGLRLLAPAPSGTAATDTAALQALINAAAAAGGGEVHLQTGIYRLDATLTILNTSNVWLTGEGAFHDIFGGLTSPTGTVLAWYGSAGGTMLSVGGTNAMTTYNRDQRVEDLVINGRDIAGTGLLVTSSWWGQYRNLHARGCTTVAVDVTTVTNDIASTAEDTQGCIFEKISIRATSSAKGIRLDSGTDGLGNTSFCTFSDIDIYHADGIGLELRDTDNLRFYGVWATAGGTGYSVEFHGSTHASSGHARYNYFFGAEMGGGIMTRATGYTLLPHSNVIYALSRGNSSPLPVTEGAAYTYYETTAGVPGAIPNDSMVTGRNAAGTGLVNLFRTNAANELQVEATARFNGQVIVGNGLNIQFSTVTGSRIGTAADQKLAFFNTTPVVQRSAISSPAADVNALKTAVDALRQALIDLGLTAA